MEPKALKSCMSSINRAVESLRSRGIIIRSREERVKEVLEFVRREYPGAMVEDLPGDLNEYALIVNQQEWCQNCNPGRCPTSGRLWFVDAVVTGYGSEERVVYVPRFQTCGLHRKFLEDRAAKFAPKARDVSSSGFTGFRGFAPRGGAGE